MLNCNAVEQERLDALLDEIYQRSLDKLSLQKRKQLQKSQHNWKKAHPRKCAHEPEQKLFESGTAATLFYYVCILTETDARIHWLEEHHRSNTPRAK